MRSIVFVCLILVGLAREDRDTRFSRTPIEWCSDNHLTMDYARSFGFLGGRSGSSSNSSRGVITFHNITASRATKNATLLKRRQRRC
uniref:Putative secreted protein n=1 Tax=Anopheles marajoara TaxID=58244 RepID=A0A2M4CAA9_9DIPT